MDRLGTSSARIALVNSSRDPDLCNQVHSSYGYQVQTAEVKGRLGDHPLKLELGNGHATQAIGGVL